MCNVASQINVNVRNHIAMSTYNRLSIARRGHFSSLFVLFAVTQISISREGLEIKARFLPPRRFSWAQVSVKVEQRKAAKGYGGYSSAEFVQRICSIRAEGRKFTFDVSDDFPDLDHSADLLNEIGIFCEVTYEPVRNKSIKSWWTTFNWY